MPDSSSPTVSRRDLLRVAAVAAALSLGLDSCSTDNDSAETPPASTAASRSVTTVAGDVQVPGTVTRVVTTHNIATQPLVDLGFAPVGIGEMDEASSYPAYWQAIKDIPQVTSAGGTNIEQVAGLDPDVIFSINVTDAGEIAKLRSIAPVVQIGIQGTQRADWQGRADLVAEVVGAPETAKELRTKYGQRAADIKAAYSAQLAANTFTVVDSFEAGAIYPSSPGSMIGNIVVAAGGRFSPAASSAKVKAFETEAGGADGASLEDLPDIADGTVILYGSQPEDGQPSTAQQALLDSPLFKKTPAARAGRVFPIGKTLIAGYGDAFGALDNFEAALKKL